MNNEIKIFSSAVKTLLQVCNPYQYTIYRYLLNISMTVYHELCDYNYIIFNEKKHFNNLQLNLNKNIYLTIAESCDIFKKYVQASTYVYGA